MKQMHDEEVSKKTNKHRLLQGVVIVLQIYTDSKPPDCPIELRAQRNNVIRGSKHPTR